MNNDQDSVCDMHVVVILVKFESLMMVFLWKVMSERFVAALFLVGRL